MMDPYSFGISMGNWRQRWKRTRELQLLEFFPFLCLFLASLRFAFTFFSLVFTWKVHTRLYLYECTINLFAYVFSFCSFSNCALRQFDHQMFRIEFQFTLASTFSWCCTRKRICASEKRSHVRFNCARVRQCFLFRCDLVSSEFFFARMRQSV